MNAADTVTLTARCPECRGVAAVVHGQSVRPGGPASWTAWRCGCGFAVEADGGDDARDALLAAFGPWEVRASETASRVRGRFLARRSVRSAGSAADAAGGGDRLAVGTRAEAAWLAAEVSAAGVPATARPAPADPGRAARAESGGGRP